ncbi:hypothetical protein EWM64_g9008 [Hericium alpestre]|uniref:Uncharacterized protein n=1 Tax=Hericium alpestre TaxID=135208 RepID=A0A4Y9ZK89_9AGAM|nr:hypothetical protein EWM64_g9008 [Hericium alpestre]
MSYRPPPPGSPGLPPTLYSGMSSLQIGQRGTRYGALQQSLHPTASQPHKALLKAPKAEHAQRLRKSEHPGSTTPWKDPRKAAATSAGHKHVIKDEVVTRRIIKDEAVARQMSPYWSVFPPDARSSSRKETEEMLRTFKDCLRDQKVENQELRTAYEDVLDVEQDLDRMIRAIPERNRALEDLMLRVRRIAPDEESRRKAQNSLDSMYKSFGEIDEIMRKVDPTYPM